MSSHGRYRAKASEYTDLAKAAPSPEQASELHWLGQSFSALADNEKWVSEHYHRTVHAPIDSQGLPLPVVNKPPLPVSEEQILRHLGAALIMRWHTLPMKLQKELFDAAGSMGELLDTAGLRGEIARFLHTHKDARE